MDKWALIHAFRKKVANGEAIAIKCPDCNDELFVAVGADMEPVLRCYYCRSIINPGLNVWEQIKRVLNDD